MLLLEARLKQLLGPSPEMILVHSKQDYKMNNIIEMIVDMQL
jgi:hypothetical protein